MANAKKLTEVAIVMIRDYIKANIGQALADVRADRGDAKVSTGVPQSYFIFPKAWGYQCPAVFVIDEDMDFQISMQKANFINALLKVNVSVKVEDKDQESLTIKAWRYQSALYEVLNLAEMINPDSTVKIKVVVTKIEPSGIYTYKNDEADTTASFYKEYLLRCDVNFFESF